ncbi:MAG: RNA polymerase subunit sigma-70, partial [Clostridiales bacterium]|nr:RNA polymerase subunit sigma-70 [Clostridiales bacterium]
YHFAGFRTGEIAVMLDVPAATVRTRLARARRKLKLALTEGVDGL